MMKGVSGLFSEVRGSTKNKTYKTYGDKRKLIICKDKVRLPYVRSAAQGTQRDKFKEGKDYWNMLTDEEKEQYKEEAKEHKLTGYQYFMGKWLRGEIILYTYYKVTINNTNNSNNLTDYTILLTISNDSQFFTDCENNKNYIRAYDTDKETPLSYWIEQWDTTGKNAKIWIKIPSIPANSTKYIYIRIDKELTESGEDPENTFLFFDDATTNKSSSYSWVDIYHSGQPFSLSYNSANKYYSVTQTTSDNGFLEILPLQNQLNIEIYAEFMHATRPSNSQYGFITRFYNNTYYLHRTESYPSPDRINIMIRSGTTETTLAQTNFSGDIIRAATWYKAIARAAGTYLYIWTDLENKTISANDSRYTGTRHGLSFAYDPHEYRFKNVRARKYTTPEPTISYTKET